MPLSPSIEVTVSKDGKDVKIEVQNADDNTCLKMSKTVEEAMGAVKKRVAKAEMTKQPVVAEKVKVGR